jgi:hypothetical protein
MTDSIAAPHPCWVKLLPNSAKRLANAQQHQEMHKNGRKVRENVHASGAHLLLDLELIYHLPRSVSSYVPAGLGHSPRVKYRDSLMMQVHRRVRQARSERLYEVPLPLPA